VTLDENCTSDTSVHARASLALRLNDTDVLKYAVAAMLASQGKGCWKWLEAEQLKKGLAHGSKKQRLAEWLGKKIKMERREMSEMCHFSRFGINGCYSLR